MHQLTNLQIIKDHVNKDGSGNHAYYDVGMWTCLAAMILMLIGTIIVFFTCCTDRKKNRGTYHEKHTSHHSRKRSQRSNYDNGAYVNDGYTNGATTTTRKHRRFF